MQDSQRRCQVHYSGRVQGVGFRYSTCAIAATHGMAGYVRNLPDGRVELVVEGRPDEVKTFLEAIAERMGDFIDHQAAEWTPSVGDLPRFEIRH